MHRATSRSEDDAPNAVASPSWRRRFAHAGLGVLRRLVKASRDRRGAGAVEFALVGTIFMVFVGMIFDSGILLFQQAILDNAVARASRLIRTGQIQLAGGAVAPFNAQICNDVGTVVDCSILQVKVTSAATFAALSTAVVSDGHGVLTGTGFSPGTSGQDVVVQVAWNRPYYVVWFGNFVNPGGTQLMVSTTAFRNELYN